MKKLISIGVALALLTMVVAPAAVGAGEEDWTPPTPQPPVATNETGLDTLPGGIVWTYLGVQDIVGQATADATQHIAAVLGGWSDELADPAFTALDGVLGGVGDLLVEILDLAGMPDLGPPIQGIFAAIAGFFSDLLLV